MTSWHVQKQNRVDQSIGFVFHWKEHVCAKAMHGAVVGSLWCALLFSVDVNDPWLQWWASSEWWATWEKKMVSWAAISATAGIMSKSKARHVSVIHRPAFWNYLAILRLRWFYVGAWVQCLCPLPAGYETESQLLGHWWWMIFLSSVDSQTSVLACVVCLA